MITFLKRHKTAALVLVSLAVSFFAGYYIKPCGSAPVITQGTTIETVKQTPGNYDEAMKCFYSTIKISGVVDEKETLHVTAESLCKKAETDFHIVCPPAFYRYSFLVFPMISAGYVNRVFVPYCGGGLGLVRNFNRFGIGGNVFYLQSIGGLDKMAGASLVLKIDF